MVRRLLLCSTALVCFLCGGGFAAAQTGGEDKWQFEPTFNDYGATGLIQMPSGRMAADGEMAFGLSSDSVYTRYFFTLQALPWLQGTFRFTNIGYVPYPSYRVGGETITPDQDYKDKGVDLKVRLVKEGPHLPDISVGFRDLGGTGLFSSEYIAASRRYYDWSFTAGLAWGNMGTRGHVPNPFGLFSERFKTRPRSEGTGNLIPGFFRGERASLFAGIEWDTPMPGLALQLEYDGNDYQSEYGGRAFEVAAPYNVGATYAVTPWFRLGASFQRGNTLALRGLFRTNFNEDRGVPHINEVPPLPVPPREEATRVLAGLSEQRGPELSEVLLDFQPTQFFRVAEAYGVQVGDITIEPPVASIALLNEGRVRDERLGELSLALSRLPTLSDIETVAFYYPQRRMRKYVDVQEASRLHQLTGVAALPMEDGSLEQRVRSCAYATLNLYPFKGEALALRETSAILVYSQSLYAERDVAAARAARALLHCVPPGVETLDLIQVGNGLPLYRTRILREAIERLPEHGTGDVTLAADGMQVPWLPRSIGAASQPAESFPRLSTSLAPHIRQSVGGPDSFYLYQVYLTGSGELRLTPRLSIGASVGAEIVSNLEELKFEEETGSLPHVRSDIYKYLEDRRAWLDGLVVNYVAPLAPEWHGRLSAGLFEWMYGGVGGEVLYKPTGEPWALGLDLNHVWQRSYGGWLGFRDYEVTTGHLTWYHELPWYDLRSAISVGRYLAKDVGATVNLSREFENGLRFGAWATKTNVSAEEFGEGSFDKGMYVSIPLELFYTRPSTSRATVSFAPLTRDGGQKLAIPKPLYGITQ